MIDPGIRFRRVAVLGAGVMGAQIAAHLANAGIPVDLFELCDDPNDPRSAAREAIERLAALRPAPLGSERLVAAIRPAAYSEDLDRLAHCDLVIEAVAERIDIKRALYEQVGAALGRETVFASNTSGLPIETLAAALPAEVQPRFCGVHFFNPPRYMHLVELIAHPETDRRVLHRLEGFLVTSLGKGVLHARDTPGFIGNRVGMFALCAVMQHADRLGLPFDVVDQLTGPGMGRPKSATYRTIDVVGLDTFAHVVRHLHDTLPEDPWRHCYAIPDWMQTLIDAGSLGQKARRGIYRKGEGGIEVLDPANGDYRPVEGSVDARVQAALRESDLLSRHALLEEIDHPHAELVCRVQQDVFHYCAHHLETIAPSAREVDFAMRWGFAWETGPFETWQQLGWQKVAQGLEQAINDQQTLATAPLRNWVTESLRRGVHGPRGSWSADESTWVPRSTHPVYRRQRFPERLHGEPAPAVTTLWQNDAVQLWDAGDDIAVLSLRTPMHAISQAALDGMHSAIVRAEEETAALVLWQWTRPFSVGADLKFVLAACRDRDYAAIASMLVSFQQVTGLLRHARIPVIGAPYGMALGGGMEILLNCDARVLAFESQLGLVEPNVGVIPAGGGCAAVARRAAAWSPNDDVLPWIEHFFDEIFHARVTASAHDARGRHWLDEGDRFVMNADERLHGAHAMAHTHAETGYRPPMTEADFPVAGRAGLAQLRKRLDEWQGDGQISDHDRRVGDALAFALCGGDVEAGSHVTDEAILQLEREGFMALVETAETVARIEHTLKTGKPLRN